VLDVSDRAAFFAFAEAVVNTFGQVDLVINNAGVALGRATVGELPIKDFEWIVGINMWGMVHGTQAFLQHLVKQQVAAGVNVSRLFGLMGVAEQAAYSTTKFAIRGFTESMRMEARDAYPGLQVISVHPGGISTNIAQASRNIAAESQAMHDADISNFEKVLRMPAEKAAKKILRGIRKNRGRILIGYDAKLLDKLVRLLPRRYVGIIGKRIAKEKRKVMAAFASAN
jgi:NAD(P)-dependent dehydrogenase (short-subunit alcohol dehydrogenase family)